MKIAILTSGGDAPGMNACIRAMVRLGVSKGHEMVGIMRGYQGLMTDERKALGVPGRLEHHPAGRHHPPHLPQQGVPVRGRRAQGRGPPGRLGRGGAARHRRGRDLPRLRRPDESLEGTYHRHSGNHRQRSLGHRLHHRLQHRRGDRPGIHRQDPGHGRIPRTHLHRRGHGPACGLHRPAGRDHGRGRGGPGARGRRSSCRRYTNA